MRGSPAPESSLSLADQVSTERLVVSLVQSFEGCCVLRLVIAEAGNPGVGGLEVRSDGKEGSEVGNELLQQGLGCWPLCCGWRHRYRWVDFVGSFLDKKSE